MYGLVRRRTWCGGGHGERSGTSVVRPATHKLWVAILLFEQALFGKSPMLYQYRRRLFGFFYSFFSSAAERSNTCRSTRAAVPSENSKPPPASAAVCSFGSRPRKSVWVSNSLAQRLFSLSLSLPPTTRFHSEYIEDQCDNLHPHIQDGGRLRTFGLSQPYQHTMLQGLRDSDFRKQTSPAPNMGTASVKSGRLGVSYLDNL